MKNCPTVFLFLVILFEVSVFASPTITISNSAEEVIYSYELTYRSLVQVDEELNIDPFGLADFNAAHLYGIFHSAQYVEQFGLSPDLYEGFAGTQKPVIISAQKIIKPGDPYLWIKYSARGKMLVLKPILQKWLGSSDSGNVRLPLLYNFPLIYLDDMSGYKNSALKKCTDRNYQSPSDFSYFYTPYLCEELNEEPLAENVEFKITKIAPPQNKTNLVPLDSIRADNGNGKLVVLYFVFGFDGHLPGGSSVEEIRNDSGWKLYRALHNDLEENYNFTKTKNSQEFKKILAENISNINLLTPTAMAHDSQRRYFSTHIRNEGDNITVIRSALFDTSIIANASPLLSYPKFWKEAWENGDFIYYGGHSGDGANLNIAGLLNSLRYADIKNINFQINKTQIAFIDACSSYAHFLDMYNALKPENLHIITFGVVSLFHLAKTSVETTLRLLLNTPTPLHWSDALREIEMDQLKPHIEFLYGRKIAKKMIAEYARTGEHPSFLLNVSAPRQ